MFLNRRIATKGGDVFRDEFSVAFDGTDEYLDCGSDSSLDVGTNDFSVSAWYKVSTKGGSDYHDIAAKGDTLTTGNGWGIALTESNKKIYFDTNGDVGRQNVISPADSWEFDKWYHIIATRSNSTNTLNLYLNGVFVATNTSATNDDLGDASINFKIGTSESSRETKGNISEVAYYNTALTASQVKTIYNGREPYNHKEGVASNYLKAWYRMGDGILDNYAIICDETNVTLGSNVISNGTFTSDSNWNKNSMWSISGGVAVSDGSGSSNINQSGSLIVGKLYKITFDIVSLTSGSGYSVRAGSSGTYSEVFNTIGTHTSYQMCLGSFNNIYINANGNAAGSIDKVKAQLIGGKAAGMINMSANDIEGDTP